MQQSYVTGSPCTMLACPRRCWILSPLLLQLGAAQNVLDFNWITELEKNQQTNKQNTLCIEVSI
jgi:hypothetical protein